MRPGRANLRPGRANLRPRWSTGGGTEGRTEGQKDGRLKIPPCVLQDIGPLGPLPKKENIKGDDLKNGQKTAAEKKKRAIDRHGDRHTDIST